TVVAAGAVRPASAGTNDTARRLMPAVVFFGTEKPTFSLATVVVLLPRPATVTVPGTGTVTLTVPPRVYVVETSVATGAAGTNEIGVKVSYEATFAPLPA